MTEYKAPQGWTLVRVGKYASSIAAILGLGFLTIPPVLDFRDTFIQMQVNVQSLVDDMALQNVANRSRKKEFDAAQVENQKLQEQLEQVVNTLSNVVNTTAQNSQLLAELQGTADRDPSPAIFFPRSGHSISDGEVGGFVRMKFSFYKKRDCGAPKLDLYFINGSGIRHRFRQASIIGQDNRGVNLEVDGMRLQEIVFVSRIPADDGVTPGRASGWIEASYPELCPATATVASPVLNFTISE